MPLEVHRAEPLVVTVDQRIGQRLTQGPLRVVRHAHAQQAHHQLLFAIARTNPRFDLFHHPEQGPAEEIVDLDIEATQHLERDFITGYESTKSIVLPEEEHRSQAQRSWAPVGNNHAEGLRQFQVRQVEKGFVAASPTFADTSSEALELERVQILPPRAAYHLR